MGSELLFRVIIFFPVKTQYAQQGLLILISFCLVPLQAVFKELCSCISDDTERLTCPARDTILDLSLYIRQAKAEIKRFRYSGALGFTVIFV